MAETMQSSFASAFKSIASGAASAEEAFAGMAQGILESNSGKGSLALKSNNHFGIKCHKGWRGKKVYHDDDEKGE